jgi:hypothetical protein
MAMSDLKGLSSHPSLKVAACDVDLSRAEEFRRMFPEARVYQDFREFWRWRSNRPAIRTTRPIKRPTRAAFSSARKASWSSRTSARRASWARCSRGYEIEKVAGGNHWHQFIDAARGEGRTGANFDYAGPLTEAVLLGSVASRFPQQELKWDAAALKFTNVESARLTSTCAASTGQAGRNGLEGEANSIIEA